MPALSRASVLLASGMRKLAVVLFSLFGLFPSLGFANGGVVLLESSTTRKFFEANFGKYDLMLDQWKAFATRQSVNIRFLSTDQLRNLTPGTVAILPATVALDEREREQLEAAAARGVHLIATWAFAPRDAKGTWMGYGLLKKLFETEVLGEIKADSDERFFQPYAETPITMGLPPLKRVFLSKVSEPLLRAVATFPAGRLSDWSRSVSKDSASLAAVSYYETKNSRRVWIGMPETSWTTALADVDRLLLDSLNWLQRRPAASMSNWPAPFHGAFLLEMDTEDKFANALLFEEELTKRGLRGTFYCLTEQAVKHPEVVRKIAQKHEVAYHADVHTGFRGLSAAAQDARLSRMIAELSPLMKDLAPPSGFRAPLEEFDIATEILLRAKGIRHHATSPDYADVALPLFSKSEPELSTEEALVLLPRTMLDDVNFFRMGMLEKSISGVLLNSAKKVVQSRGFGLLSLHTQNYGAGSALQRDMPALLDELASRRDTIWIASGDQIEKWWREKSRVTLSSVPSDRSLTLRLQVKAPAQVRNAQIIVTVPNAGQVPKIATRIAHSVQKLDEQRFALIFPELKVGASEIRVSF